APCAARVVACVVWLPPDTQLHGRFLEVSPQAISTFSQGTPSISAATRWQSDHDSVPRLPTPVWMYMRPSGLTTKSPSKPTEPALYALIATPVPRTFDPRRCPLRALRSSHLKSCAPLSSASLMKQLVVYVLSPRGFGGPNLAFPAGALIFLISI